MLQRHEYRFLVSLLEGTDSARPELETRELHHIKQGALACHLVAMQAGVETGFPPILGVHFLEFHGKLYPWAHAVNVSDHGLVDYSQDKIAIPDFGFWAIQWGNFSEWRNIMAAYQRTDNEVIKASSWGDPFADALTNRYLPLLRKGCRLANRMSL